MITAHITAAIWMRKMHMKHDVLTFIDSDTLREMLRGKELAPAVECILIAQSRKQCLTKKLEALTERADAYTETEFQTGVYHLCDCDECDCDDFSGALRKNRRHGGSACADTDN